MKRLLISLGILIFALGFVGVSFGVTLRDQASSVIAKGGTTASVEKNETEATRSAAANYYLAYPGILPDHPLYFVKMMRDRLWLWLTRSPQAKVERLLLYADKRIGAAEVLAKGNQFELSSTTAIKAEKYYEQAVREAAELPETAPRYELWYKLSQAGLKHQTILTTLLTIVPDEQQGGVEQALTLSGEAYGTVVASLSELTAP